MAYEEAYPKTPVGVVEVKDLPDADVMEAEAPGDYFGGRNVAFRRLFGFLQRNRLAMTVPVEGDVDRAAMRFFVERGKAEGIASDAGVSVEHRAAMKVASIGGRGTGGPTNFAELLGRLQAWLDRHPEWEPTGGPSVVSWSGPLVPWFLRRVEVHVPVRPAASPGP